MRRVMFGGTEMGALPDRFRGLSGFVRSLAKTSMNTFSVRWPRKRLEPDYVSGGLVSLCETYDRKVFHNRDIFLETACCSNSRSIRQ